MRHLVWSHFCSCKLPFTHIHLNNCNKTHWVTRSDFGGSCSLIYWQFSGLNSYVRVVSPKENSGKQHWLFECSDCIWTFLAPAFFFFILSPLKRYIPYSSMITKEYFLCPDCSSCPFSFTQEVLIMGSSHGLDSIITRKRSLNITRSHCHISIFSPALVESLALTSYLCSVTFLRKVEILSLVSDWGSGTKIDGPMSI